MFLFKKCYCLKSGFILISFSTELFTVISHIRITECFGLICEGHTYFIRWFLRTLTLLLLFNKNKITIVTASNIYNPDIELPQNLVCGKNTIHNPLKKRDASETSKILF